ncbi:MAG: hypothetical protein K2J05_08015, partial [Muribaculaceae bacterium]|nr:hypothetical protein [Muribaculaceae bacterium]
RQSLVDEIRKFFFVNHFSYIGLPNVHGFIDGKGEISTISPAVVAGDGKGIQYNKFGGDARSPPENVAKISIFNEK